MTYQCPKCDATGPPEFWPRGSNATCRECGWVEHVGGFEQRDEDDDFIWNPILGEDTPDE